MYRNGYRPRTLKTRPHGTQGRSQSPWNRSGSNSATGAAPTIAPAQPRDVGSPRASEVSRSLASYPGRDDGVIRLLPRSQRSQ